MLAVLSRVRSPCMLFPDTLLGQILARELRGKQLNSLSPACCPFLPGWGRRVTGGVRHVRTTAALSAKARGIPQKRELSEKKLVCAPVIWSFTWLTIINKKMFNAIIHKSFPRGVAHWNVLSESPVKVKKLNLVPFNSEKISFLGLFHSACLLVICSVSIHDMFGWRKM